MEAGVGGGVNVFIFARGEDGVEVRRECNVGAGTIFERVGDDVAAAVDAGDAAKGAELGEHPFGAALLEERGGGDAAELEVLLIDPLFLADEPGEGVAEGRGSGEVGRDFGERSVGRDSDGFEGRGQVLV